MKTKKNVIKEASKVVDEAVEGLKQIAKEKPVAKKTEPKKASVKPFRWDFPMTADIGFFDASLSYELSGYRPISKTEGLDFDPSWFTEARDEFLATGHYTSYLPGSKGYRDFWHEEYRRCRDGHTVNGYTVTGDHYFFMNFYQLPIVEGKKRAGSGRRTDFPEFFVSQYQFFHYVDLARRLHKHVALMKARGIGFSEIGASMAANEYTTVKESVTMILCYDRGKLDRTLSKVWNALRFLDTHTDGGMFKLRQLSDTALVKKSGHYNMVQGNRVPAGWQSVIEGVVADDPQKIRGDRVDFMMIDEAGCHAPGTEVLMHDCSIKKVEDVKVGDKLMGPDGTARTVIELHHGTDQMYKLVSDNREVQVVNSNHIIYGKKYDYNAKTFSKFSMTAKEYYDMVTKAPRKGDGYKLCKATLEFPHQDVPIPPYIFGLWLGDGDSDGDRFANGDPEVIECLREYAKSNGSDIKIRKCGRTVNCFHITFTRRDGEKTCWFRQKLKELGVIDNKHIPDCYLFNDRETQLQVLAGLIDSDGNYSADKHIVEITQCEYYKKVFDGAVFLCHSLGLKMSVGQRYSTPHMIGNHLIKGGVLNYRLRIQYGHSQIPTLIARKRTVDRVGNGKGSVDKLAHSFKIHKAGVGEYYGFTLDKDQLFLLSDFTICHNSYPNLLKAFVQAQALLSVGNQSIASAIIGGTGGDKGASLEGLRTIYYHPDTYGVLPYRHHYTSDGSTILSGYFIPAFTQSMVPGMTDSRGWCDEEKNKELQQKERDQYLSVPQSLIHYCAEYCWTAEEAFALEGDNKFNKILLAEQLAQIRLHKIGPRPTAGYIDYIYKDGIHKPENISGFKWVPTKDGKIQILEHPVWSECYKRDIQRQEAEAERKGQKFEKPPVYKEMSDLYVAGVDGIDIGKDQTSSETRNASEFCLVIKRRAFGMREPQVVCIYKDRPNEVRTAYKTAMCLIRYYNCKVNVEATRVGFINWARYTNQLNWFMRRPQSTLQNIRNGNSKSYGTPASSHIVEMQTDLIASFVEDYCHTIWYEDMLDQLVRYSYENKTQFDIIAAMGMVELADQELTGRAPIVVREQRDTFQDFGYFIDDNGYRQWGVIPRENRQEVLYGGGEAYDPYRIETSDSRYYTNYEW